MLAFTTYLSTVDGKIKCASERRILFYDKTKKVGGNCITIIKDSV